MSQPASSRRRSSFRWFSKCSSSEKHSPPSIVEAEVVESTTPIESHLSVGDREVVMDGESPVPVLHTVRPTRSMRDAYLSVSQDRQGYVIPNVSAFSYCLLERGGRCI